MHPGRSSHPLSAVAFLVSATLFSSTMAAAGAQAPPPTFAADAEVVTVDVLVLDEQGKPVHGLSREDFRVLEDGIPQTLTAFETVEAKLPEAPPPAATAPASRVVSNAMATPTRRTFGIVFDDLHLDHVEIEPMRKALRAFLARETRPGDRLLLLTTSDGRFWTTTGGAESASFTAALEQVRSHRPLELGFERRLTPYEAMAIMREPKDTSLVVPHKGVDTSVLQRTERRQRAESAGQPTGEKTMFPETPEEAYAQATELLGRSLATLRDGIAMLGAQRDRKALVLVSEGFIMDTSLHGFREVRDAAARANAVLYFLNAQGLATGPRFQGAGHGAIPERDFGLTMLDWRQEADGARTLAEETGGLSLETNDFLGALRRVADESRVAYLLGYEPRTSRRDGRYHRLKVEVLRRGLKVRARAGYFAAKGGKATASPDGLQRALHDPFDRAEIPLRLATYLLGPAAAETDKGKIEVMVAAELRSDALESRVVDGRAVAEPRVLLSVARRDRLAEIVELPLKIAAPTAAPEKATGRQRWQPFATRVLLEPGDNRLRLLAESGGRVGSLTTDLAVPTLDDERLSTPILSDEVAGEGRLPLVPIARRSFAAADTLHCWVELHGAKAAPDTRRPRTATSFRVRAADGREWAAGSFEGKAGEQELTGWLVSVPLRRAPEGDSELLLTVRDLVSGRTFESRESFRVRRRGDRVRRRVGRLRSDVAVRQPDLRPNGLSP